MGRKCLCNSLLANVGLAEPQVLGTPEPPLLTAGDDIEAIRSYFAAGAAAGDGDYGAADVLRGLRSQPA